MALSRAETQITWSSSAQLTCSANSTRYDSDVVTFNDADVSAVLQVSCSTTSSASGDYVDVFVRYTNGDLLQDSGDDYDTDEHAIFLGRIDNYASNTPGEQPARTTFVLPTTVPKAMKIVIMTGSNAATRNNIVYARLRTLRA